MGSERTRTPDAGARMPSGGPRLGRPRPANRREIILDAAARAFSSRGYHCVRLDEIAADAEISVPALYRHFPNKYALFADTTGSLAEKLTAALDPVADADLHTILDALTVAAIANRRTGGLYRWESRYLEPDDAKPIRDVLIRQHRTVRRGLLDREPGLDKADADLITAAMMSVIASPTTHRAAMSARQIRELLVGVALSLGDVALPASHSLPQATGGLTPLSKREALLHESVALFAQHGFHTVTVDDIARAAGMPTSGVYRHFPSKAAILEASFWRAQDRMSATIADALGEASTPAEAIEMLVSRNVRQAMARPDLVGVYMSELWNVSPEQRRALRKNQRVSVDEWSAWVSRANPARSPAQSRFLVHAALGTIFDLVRLDRDITSERISALATRLLLP